LDWSEDELTVFGDESLDLIPDADGLWFHNTDDSAGDATDRITRQMLRQE